MSINVGWGILCLPTGNPASSQTDKEMLTFKRFRETIDYTFNKLACAHINPELTYRQLPQTCVICLQGHVNIHIKMCKLSSLSFCPHLSFVHFVRSPPPLIHTLAFTCIWNKSSGCFNFLNQPFINYWP